MQQNELLMKRLKGLIGPLIALAIILIYNLIATDGFFTITIKQGHLFGSLVDIFNRGAPTMLLAIGMTLVYATGGIDLSVGAIMAISGAVAAYIIRPGYVKGILEYGEAASLIWVITIPLLVAVMVGLWNGFLVSYVGIQPFIATLILMMAGRGIAQLITKGQILIFEHPGFEHLGSGFLFGLPFPIILFLALFIITIIVTRKSALGMFIEATGSNPRASRYIGIDTKNIKLLVYAFSGFCAGLAGLIAIADIKGADANRVGLNFELYAIASVIIGGTIWGGRFSIVGSIIGALIIQSLTTSILTRGVPPQFTQIVMAIAVIAVTLIQSERFRSRIIGLKNLIRKGAKI